MKELIDKLASEESKGLKSAHDKNLYEYGYEEGFRKALELIKNSERKTEQ